MLPALFEKVDEEPQYTTKVRMWKTIDYLSFSVKTYEVFNIWVYANKENGIHFGRCFNNLVDFNFPLVGELLEYHHRIIDTENNTHKVTLSFAGGVINIDAFVKAEQRQKQLFELMRQELSSDEAIRRVEKEFHWKITTKTLVKKCTLNLV